MSKKLKLNSQAQGWSQQRWALAIIPLFTFILYGNSIFNDYALDDKTVVTENILVKKGFSEIPKLISNAYWYGYNGMTEGSYRPIPLITHAVEYGLFGQNPLISHFFNILLFAFCGIILFNTLKNLFLKHNLLIPWITTLLFIAHPVHAEVVANIKGRDELICFVGIISSVFFLLKYLTSTKIKHALIAAFCFLGGLLSKEIALSFIVIFPFIFYIHNKLNIKNLRNIILSFSLIFGIYFLLRATCTESLGDIRWFNSYFMHSTDNSARLATAIYNLYRYISLMIFPHPLVYDYSYNQIPLTSWSNIKGWGSLLLNLGLITTAIVYLKKNKIISLGIFIFYATIAMVANIAIPMAAIFAERFLFLPSLGFCLILAWAIIKLSKSSLTDKKTNIFKSTPLVAMLSIILIAYSYKTIGRNFTWKNNFTLFKSDIENLDNNARAHFNLGREYAISGLDANKGEDIQLALNYLKRSLEIDPKFYDSQFLLAVVHSNLKKHKEAINHYKRAIALNPPVTDPQNSIETALLNLGISHEALGNYQEAITSYKSVIMYRPKTRPVNKQSITFAYNNLGNLYNSIKDYNNAIKHCTKAIELNPGYTKAYLNLANAYLNKKDNRKAIINYQKAIQLNPRLADAYINLAIAYLNLKDFSNANQQLNKAIQINPNYAKAHHILGIAMKDQGKLKEAIKHFKEAARLNPQYKKRYQRAGLKLN
ncbi:MAG: tetratricopeptide repeat protein [Bacteroidia bacterium]|nr:tetratricopeptide repeat protein [Bacteroidia bacterium]